MKSSLFTRLFSRKRRQTNAGAVTPEDIRRKLASYQKLEGPASFGGPQLYSVEEVDSPERASRRPEQGNG